MTSSPSLPQPQPSDEDGATQCPIPALPAPFTLKGMTDPEVEALMKTLPHIIAVHEKIQQVLDLFRTGKATITDLQRTLYAVVSAEYTRRKAAVEKSLQEGVKSRHIALNDKYVELMDYLACPWIQSVLPQSLACQDLAYWSGTLRDRDRLPTIKLPARIRELAGLEPDDLDDDEDLLGEDEDDGRKVVEPMLLKEREGKDVPNM